MNKLVKSKIILFFTTLFSISNIYSQQQQVYHIPLSSLINATNNCDGTGNNYYGDNIGFTWTDNLPSGAIINSVTIEYNIGINCAAPTTITPTLNSNNQSTVTFSGDCNCTPSSTSFVSHIVNKNHYNSNGTNTYTLVGTNTVGFNNLHSSLNSSFAKVTIDYSSFSGPVPSISSFTPSSGICNSVVTINGTNFDNGTPIVKFNGITANHTYISATQLTATVPAGATSGAITVQTGGGIATSSSNFSFNSPTISSFSPSSETCNAQVTINGTNFSSNSTVVKFNGITANHTFVSSNQLIATIPSGNTTGLVTVQTCNSNTATSSSNFTLNTPTISSFSPSSATCNTPITINGTNFNSNSTVVKFNGITANHTFINSTQLIATVPAGNTSGTITVQTCSSNTASSSSNFTLITSTPTISSISSSTGTRGTIITITGTNLTCPTNVSFGGTAAYSFNATSSTSITAEVGYGSSGNIAVTTAGGTATFSGFTYTAPSAANSVNITGASTTNNITNNIPTIVDNSLSMSSNGTINGCIVTITESYQSGDVLAYNSATGGALPAGITVAPFNTTTRSLVFSGSAIGADWEKILRNVTIQTTSAVCAPESRKVAFIVGDVYYNPLNNHFYKASTSNTSWTTAKTNAENLSYFGKQGYLATPSSQAENSFISRLLGQNSWIGCSDRFSEINTALGYTLYASSGSSVTVGGVTYTGNNNNGNAEGNWFWVTGPEKGTRIRNGNATNLGGSGSFGVGSAVTGVYQNWDGTEPNDYSASDFGDEDYGHIYSVGPQQGLWNDFPDNQSIGSVIEFGDMPGDNTSGNINTVYTRNIYINGAPSGTITGGNVDVCSGTNSTTLTLTGLASGGTVTRWEYSLDNFLTAGITVNSTSTSLTISNIAETRYYRAIVSVSGCTNLATSSTRIGVATTTAGSIVSNKSAICTGGSTELTLSGNIGSVIRWEKSTSSTFASGVTSISNTTTSLIETLNTAGTYYYRAVVQQSGCGSAVNTNGYPVTVTAGTPPVGGTISSTSSCSGTNNITLTLSGHSGNITKWQYSSDGGFVWTDVANTTTTLTQTNVTTNRKYRAIVSTSNQACGNESSSSGEVTVFGTTVVRWDGTISKNSNNINNWCGGLPKIGQDIVINTSASNDILLEQDRELGVIDFNGTTRRIELGNYNLKVKDLVGINASNYIKTNGTGKLTLSIPTNSEKTFYVGNSHYNPLKIKNNTNSEDEFSIRVIDSVFINGLSGVAVTNPHIKATWDISKNNSNNSSGIDMTFTWNQSQEIGGISSYILNHHNGNNWELAIGTTGNVNGTTTKSVTHTGYIGTFSPFAFGSGVSALPVELSKFKATCFSDYIQVDWTTASEIRNKAFELHKSENAQDWKLIHTIEGQGDKATETQYSFKDLDKKQGYYRLKDIDEDGIENWSQIIFADCKNEISGIQIYPNPASDFIKVIAPISEHTTLNIISLEGKVLKTISLISNQTLVSVKDLTSSIYLIEINGKTVYHKLKIVKN